jgi:hypothetical protein
VKLGRREPLMKLSDESRSRTIATRSSLLRCYTPDVHFRRLLGAAIVAICVCVPIIESFDTWDHTFVDGNDTEANLVLAALCVGLALTAATIHITPVRLLPIDARAWHAPSAATGPPTASLRI